MQFSESAIYRHFASKEEIAVPLLNYLAKSMDERLAVISQAEASAEEKFIRIFQEQMRFFSKHPHFVVAVFSDGLMEESQLINQTILKIMGVKMKHLLPIVLAGQQDGTFSNAVTTEELIQIVMGTFRLQMFMWRAANFQFDLLAKGESMIQALLYYNAQLLHHQLLFIDSNLANSGKLLATMELLKTHLLAKGTDVSKVKPQAAQLSTQKERIRSQYGQVLNALKIAMGIKLDQHLEIAPAIVYDSFVYAFVVLFSIPVAVIGAFLALNLSLKNSPLTIHKLPLITHPS